uniref:Putative secreted protein n=1 Tax=Anopheles darlingi TaxID=43151 RepID=A0A2M4DBS6_ANODA
MQYGRASRSSFSCVLMCLIMTARQRSCRLTKSRRVSVRIISVLAAVEQTTGYSGSRISFSPRKATPRQTSSL